MNRVDIQAMGIEEPTWLEAARAFALKVMEERGIDGWDLSLAFTDDPTIAELNSQYRGKDCPTDVLSFELGEKSRDPEEGERFLPGDIVISLDTLRANAAYFSVDQDEELRRLIIHGILHLSGMDHEDNDPSREMLRLQEEILSGLSKERIL